jgi:hypothetical protein
VIVMIITDHVFDDGYHRTRVIPHYFLLTIASTSFLTMIMLMLRQSKQLYLYFL